MLEAFIALAIALGVMRAELWEGKWLKAHVVDSNSEGKIIDLDIP